MSDLELYKFQRKGVRLIDKSNGRALLCDEMGLGKTIEILSWYVNFLDPRKDKIVVVCPKSVTYGWQREASSKFDLDLEVLSKRTPPLGKFRVGNGYVINYDILWNKGKRRSWLKFLRALRPKLVVIDEGVYVKNRKAKRTKAVRDLCWNVPHVAVLSGSGCMDHFPAEMWVSLNILWPEKFPSFFPFGMRYCDGKKGTFDYEYRGATHTRELNRKLRKLGMIRRRKQDVLKDLPETTTTITPVEIVGRSQYNKAYSEFLSWLKAFNPNKLDKAKKAIALAKGTYLLSLLGRLKLPYIIDWVKDFLESSDQKLVLYGVNRDSFVHKLYEKFKPISAVVTGAITGLKRQQMIDKFVEVDECRLFFGNIRAGGVGINGLQKVCSNVAFGQLDWSPEAISQAIARLHRIGQKYPVTVHFLTALDTVEERILRILQEKSTNVHSVLDGEKMEESRLKVFDEFTKSILTKKGV